MIIIIIIIIEGIYRAQDRLGATPLCGQHGVANIYRCTKFDENIFIYDQDMAKYRKFKMAAGE